MPNRRVSDLIKNQRIFTTAATTTVVDAAAQMRNGKVGAIMVVSDSRLVGIFTERDALYRVVAVGKDPGTTPLAEVMSVKLTTVTPDRLFSHALHIMYEGGFRHVPVVDQNDVPIGMISARDALGPEMEQFAAELGEREHIAEILG